LRIEHIKESDGQVVVHARSRQAAAHCPNCAQPSSSMHARYQRRVTHLPVAGRPVSILPTLRRLFCRNLPCPRRTFLEQITGLSVRRRQPSLTLPGRGQIIALALAGRAGARLAAALAITVSPMRLLRLRILPPLSRVCWRSPAPFFGERRG
jgi:transposase